jgi:hypothetical protein
MDQCLPYMVSCRVFWSRFADFIRDFAFNINIFVAARSIP